MFTFCFVNKNVKKIKNVKKRKIKKCKKNVKCGTERKRKWKTKNVIFFYEITGGAGSVRGEPVQYGEAGHAVLVHVAVWFPAAGFQASGPACCDGRWMVVVVDGRKKSSPILLKIFSDEVQVI